MSSNNKNNDMAAAIPPSSNLSSSSSKLSLTENLQQQNNIPSIITSNNSPILKKSALKLPSTNPTRRKSTTEDDVLRSPRKVSFFHSLKYHYTPQEESLNGHHLPPKNRTNLSWNRRRGKWKDGGRWWEAPFNGNRSCWSWWNPFKARFYCFCSFSKKARITKKRYVREGSEEVNV